MLLMWPLLKGGSSAARFLPHPTEEETLPALPLAQVSSVRLCSTPLRGGRLHRGL